MTATPAQGLARTLSVPLLLALASGCAATGEEPATARDPDAHWTVEDVHAKDGQEALDILLTGNRRFVEGRLHHDHEDQARRLLLEEAQHPFAIVLGCADSRVPPELILDCGLGDTFVIRVAGNVVSEDEAGSIEYAIHHLHTPLVMILGHEGCGAVTAALGHNDAGEAPELQHLLGLIRPALADIPEGLPMEEQVHRGVEANVLHSVRVLREVAQKEHGVPNPTTMIVGAVYELGTGKVRVLDGA